jgi:nitrogen-specific signal transduction histidine kinase
MYSKNLVLQRNQSLTQSNSQRISNKNQLEQLVYILAHNIKAPTARLIGLAILFKRNLPELSNDSQFIGKKIDDSVHDLNALIKDLNVIPNQVMTSNVKKLTLYQIHF